jgi:hypothetical protein
MFVLLLIIYNNAFTKYKVHELNNIWIYSFMASIIFMQLIECFIWKNINNVVYNNYFSIVAALLIVIQPIFSMMILTDTQLRNKLIFTYLLISIPYSIYQFATRVIMTSVSKTGHLRWHFFYNTPITFLIWLFFFLFSFVYEKKWGGISMGIFLLILTYYNFKKSESFGSMWCWMINVLMIYYAIYLLIFLPFLEKSQLC